MPEVAPNAVGTHLVVGDPPTQSLSQLLVPRTTMLSSLKISVAPTLQERPFQVMFVATQQTKEQKELNTRVSVRARMLRK